MCALWWLVLGYYSLFITSITVNKWTQVGGFVVGMILEGGSIVSYVKDYLEILFDTSAGPIEGAKMVADVCLQSLEKIFCAYRDRPNEKTAKNLAELSRQIVQICIKKNDILNEIAHQGITWALENSDRYCFIEEVLIPVCKKLPVPVIRNM